MEIHLKKQSLSGSFTTSGKARQLGIKEQIDTITNRYNKWLYLFHISSC